MSGLVRLLYFMPRNKSMFQSQSVRGFLRVATYIHLYVSPVALGWITISPEILVLMSIAEIKASCHF